MRRFIVDHLAPRVALDREAAHHLLEVVRIPRGGRVLLFDGAGLEAEAVLVEVREGVPILTLEGPPRAAAPPHPLHLLLGLPRGGATDDALRMATEAGATDLHPVLAHRSVARGERRGRWGRILASAAQQCGRADVPRLHPLRPLGETLEGLPEGLDGRITLPGAPALPEATGPAAVMVGPEGGWTPAETQAALARGWRPMGLGRWTLRTATAAAVAVALVAGG